MPRYGKVTSKPLIIDPNCIELTSTSCWILTFDSLGGAHRAVLNCLTRWLQYEARDKKGIVYDMPNAQYMEARVCALDSESSTLAHSRHLQVPQQPNFSDCGLYLIHYAKQLLEDQAEILEFIQVCFGRKECSIFEQLIVM